MLLIIALPRRTRPLSTTNERAKSSFALFAPLAFSSFHVRDVGDQAVEERGAAEVHAQISFGELRDMHAQHGDPLAVSV